ncbi:MAG: hypothetical protein RJA59_1130 [Pseudomonadota bacterium]
MAELACVQCGTRTRELSPSVHGWLCPQCAFRQAERDEFGYGLGVGTFGFDPEDE